MNDLFTPMTPDAEIPGAKTAPAPMGHNGPPPFDQLKLDECQKKVDAFNEAAKLWLNLEKITSEEQSGKLTDFVSGSRKTWKEIDDTRKAEKKPHDDAGNAVQAAYNPLLDTIKRVSDKVKPLQAAWLDHVAKEEAKRKAAADAEAAEKRKAAEEAAAKAAEGNDAAAEIEAERLAKEAKAAEKGAKRTTTAKAGSATGAGRTMALRTVYEVTVTNALQAFMRYRDRPEVLDVLQRLAAAEVRSKDWDGEVFAGIAVEEKKVAA